MAVWVLYVSMEQNNATMDASLTEYLSAVYNIDDPRSESMKISMAEHFGDYEHEYREDPHTAAEVVHEDDQVIVVADQCSCGESFGFCDQAIHHVEEEH